MADEYGPYRDATAGDVVWDIRCGVVRFESGVVNGDGTFITGGPYIHANATHVSVGMIEAFVNSSGELELHNDGGSPIGTVQVTCDETLKQRGIDGGPSGGGTTTRLRFHQADGLGPLDLTLQAHWDAISGDTANVWLFWLTPIQRSTGGPSPAERLTAVEATVADLQRRTPGSLARLNKTWAGETIATLNTEHDGDSIAAFNTTYEQI